MAQQRLVQYLGYFQTMKQSITEWWDSTKNNINNRPGVGAANASSGSGGEVVNNLKTMIQQKLDNFKEETVHKIDSLSASGSNDFSHIYRRKTRWEMIKISLAVCGIEFAYAAETAFVSPLLLNLGLRHRNLTFMWLLSPLLGFFITPLLGSMSDGCKSKLGRRRPFIIFLSIGIILGLLLVPNGKQLGIWFGDSYEKYGSTETNLSNTTKPAVQINNNTLNNHHILKLLEEIKTNKSQDQNEEHLKSSLDSHESIHLQKVPVNEIKLKEVMKEVEKVVPIETFEGITNINSNHHYGSDILNLTEKHSKDSKEKSDGGHDDHDLIFPMPTINLHGHSPRKVNQEKFNNLFRDVLTEWDDFVGPRNEHHNNNNEDNNNDKNGHAERNFLNNGLNSSNIENNQTNVEEAKDASNGNGEGDESGGEWSHRWGLFFTVLGTVLLDFDADACQSPSRAFMLDVTLPEDQARGLSTFTIISGVGGAMGYFLGALDWESTFIGNFFGGQVRAVFTLILFIFIGCVIVTIRSFCEIPLHALNSSNLLSRNNTTSQRCGRIPGRRVDSTRSKRRYSRFHDEDDSDEFDSPTPTNDVSSEQQQQQQETSFSQNDSVRFEEFEMEIPSPIYSTTTNSRRPPSISVISLRAASESPKLPTFKDYVKTIIKLPNSLKWLCLTNFFSWLSLVCYSLYFTDFVGEAVFEGNPNAEIGSNSRTLYQSGVRFGCLGMSLYSISCSLYSLIIEKLVERFGAKKVYFYGHLTYSLGMFLMALTCSKVGVLLFSWTSGIMYATLFTMPYLLVARYHASDIFDANSMTSAQQGEQGPTPTNTPKRGLGTDIAIVSSMVFLAQITQSLILGSLVTLIQSTVAIILSAGFFAICGAAASTQVLYLDL